MTTYKKFTKPFYLEEPTDFIFYRPSAFVVIKAFQKLPLTPNKFSILALIVAWSADLIIFTDNISLMHFAGWFILIFSILDCCDGMWARWKGNPYPYGDLVDMFVDLLAMIGHVSALCYLGAIHGDGGFIPFVSGLMILFHAGVYNDKRLKLLALEANDLSIKTAQVRKYKTEFERIKNLPGHFFSKTLMRLFLLFTKAQAAEREIPDYSPKQIARFKQVLPLWGLAAGASHLTVLALALILHEPKIYYVFALLIANIIISTAWLMERL